MQVMYIKKYKDFLNEVEYKGKRLEDFSRYPSKKIEGVKKGYLNSFKMHFRELFPMNNLNMYVTKIEDITTPEGLKYHIELKNGDSLYVYREYNSTRDNGWIYFLNKNGKTKNVNESDLKKYFDVEFNPTDLELILNRGYDLFTDYIDSLAQVRAARKYNERTMELFKNLSNNDKKLALDHLKKRYGKEDRQKIEDIFNKL